MALTFPSSPTNGQLYTDTTTGNRYIYNSTVGVWSFSSNNIGMSVSSTPPANVAPGSMWFNREIGRTFVYYDDGDSKQWIETVPAGAVDTNTIASYVNPVFASMNGAYTTANGSYATANAGFGKANTALQNTSGTFAGALTVTSNTTITNSALFAGNLTRLSNTSIDITQDDGRFGQQGLRLRGQATNTYGTLSFMPYGNVVTYSNDIMRFYNRDDTTGGNVGLIGLGYTGYTGSSYIGVSNTTFTIASRSFGTGQAPSTLALDGLKLAAPLGVGANPIFYVRQSTSQTISSGVNTKIYYDVSVYDTHSYFTVGTSGTTSRFYPTIAGYYYLMANVRTSPSGVCACDMGFYVNGTAYISQHINQTGSNDQGAFINAIVYLNGSQYVEVWYNQNGGGGAPTNSSDNLGNSNTVTWWQGMLIRANV